MPTKIKWENISLLYMFYFNFEKVLLWKVIRYSYQFFYFLFYISFDISRYHFLKLFRTWFNIIWRKIFIANLPFLTNSPNSTPPTPLMAKICYVWQRLFVNLLQHFSSTICRQIPAKAPFINQQWTATATVFLKVPTTDSLVFFSEHISRTAILI